MDNSAAHTKARREHRVPLSDAAVVLLRALPREDDFVFIGAHAGGGLRAKAMLEELQHLRPGLTVHGMRSAFRDWAGESSSFPHDVREAALAHLKGKTERAYQRGDLFNKRRQLMAAWARFCASPGVQTSAVTPIRASATP